MTNHISKRIEQHNAAIAALGARVDAIVAAAEELTLSARETLSEYQQAKRRAGKVLGDASRKYAAAQRHLRQINGLLTDLARIKRDHVAITHAVNRQLAAGRDRGPDRRRLLESRRNLRQLYARIEQTSTDGGPDAVD